MIKNYYQKIKKDETKKKLQLKGFDKHHIEECSRILCAGFSGSGKTNSVVQFIEMTSGSFFEIIIFNGQSTDEPLYDLLKEKNASVKITSDISEIPNLENYNGEHNNKLIIFDDWITLPKSQMKIIANYAIASRKKGFTCFFLVQDVIEVPKIIARNCNYILLYQMSDSRNIKYIMKLYSLSGEVDIKTLFSAYMHCIKQPLHFLMLDLKTKENKYKFRCGFQQLLKLSEDSDSEKSESD